MNEKQAVAISSMGASAAMTVGKFAIGLATGSLGLLSEGLHSLLDFGATIMTYMAVRVSDKPADEQHPYGHGKIESIAALAETGLLFVTSFWIVYEAARRLMAGQTEVEVNWWSIAVIVASILIDWSRARALTRVAKKTKSQALEADALHFSFDILSSIVVLAGLGLVALGWPKGDSIAAIGVSLFVCHAGWVLGRRTVDTLIDAAPVGASDRIAALIQFAKGVAGVQRVRIRPVGSVLFVDAVVAVGRGLSQSRVAAIRQDIEQAIHAKIPEAEITLTTEPLALDSETVHQRVMIIAAHHGASVHHITVHRAGGRLSVGFDLEIEGQRTLSEAHEISSHLEADISAEFGGDIEIETHIEPLQGVVTVGAEVDEAELKIIASQITQLVAANEFLRDPHDIRARRTPEGLIILFHCRAEPSQTVAKVHEIVDDLERRLRQERPDVWRVIVQAEPTR